MTGSASPDWPAVRRAYEVGDEPVARLAERFGLSARRIYARAQAEHWLRRSSRPRAAKPARKAASAARMPPPDTPAPAERTPPRKPGPEPPRRPGVRRGGTTRGARRALVRRLYRAIETKLEQMEARMAEDLAAGAGTATTAADHERDTRAIGALISSLTRVTEFEAGIDASPDAAAGSAGDRRLADEAERFRREVAERLARLVPRAP